MRFATRLEDSTIVIRAQDRLDSANAQVFCDYLDAAIQSAGACVVIDMQGLDYISSAGLRAVLQALRKLEQQDGKLAICSLTAGVRNVFETSGFDQLIDVHPSCSEAIAAVAN